MIITRESRKIYSNKWMSLREDSIERADGSSGIYSVVEKPDFAVIIPFDQGMITLVEQLRYPVGRRFWEFPQGSWEHDPGADLLDVARGELEQETGLVANRMFYLGRLFNAYGFSTQAFHVYHAAGLQETVKRPDMEEQDLAAKTISGNAFEEMLRSGEIQDAATLAAWMLYKLKTGQSG